MMNQLWKWKNESIRTRYTFTMLGFLIDEDEFEISPAMSRTLVYQKWKQELKRKKIVEFPENPDTTNCNLISQKTSS